MIPRFYGAVSDYLTLGKCHGADRKVKLWKPLAITRAANQF